MQIVKRKGEKNWAYREPAFPGKGQMPLVFVIPRKRLLCPGTIWFLSLTWQFLVIVGNRW